MKTIRIFVPAGPSPILLGSAIVGNGSLTNDRQIVYFEGNAFGSEQLSTFEGRLQTAASRLAAKYPTTATASLSQDDLICVGIAKTLRETETWVVDEIYAPELLQVWLGTERLPPIHGSQELRSRMAAQIYKSMSPSDVAKLSIKAMTHKRQIVDVIFESVYLD